MKKAQLHIPTDLCLKFRVKTPSGHEETDLFSLGGKVITLGMCEESYTNHCIKMIQFDHELSQLDFILMCNCVHVLQ